MHEHCVISSLPELSSVSGLADTFIIRESPATSSKIDLDRSQPLSTKVVLLVGIVDGIPVKFGVFTREIWPQFP